ncbi:MULTISPECIES: PH domain-containing protein [unclassified Corynebacterium]|uniref:PH domain-containing protein n=1 Tax=unclassified Corynebacterium TaxID=2624378 RepID=UPI001D0F3C14|nr:MULTISPECIES: PH domain-containing protein [unclassified Corynebacterium]
MSPEAPSATQFRPERFHLAVVIFMSLTMLIPISHAPALLGWFLLLPACYLWWLARARTTVTTRGITAHYAFRGPRSMTWEEFEGIGFKGSTSFARSRRGDQFSLPAVSFNSLPALAQASGGRIPDALTVGRKAVDDKVAIVRRNGDRVLITREEYAAMRNERTEQSDH